MVSTVWMLSMACNKFAPLSPSLPRWADSVGSASRNPELEFLLLPELTLARAVLSCPRSRRDGAGGAQRVAARVAGVAFSEPGWQDDLVEWVEGTADGLVVLSVRLLSFEQPRAVADTLQDITSIMPELFGDGAYRQMAQVDSVLLLACGGSYHAALTELEGCGAGNEVAAIRLYVAHLKAQIDNAYRDGREHAWTRPGFGEMGG